MDKKMANKQMEKSDLFDVFKYIQIMLNITGIWPKPDATLFYKIRGFTSYFLSAIFNALALVQIYYDFKGIENVSYALFLNLAIIFYLPKVAVFFFNRSEFYKILVNLRDPVYETYDADLDVYIKNKIKIFTRLQMGFQVLCSTTLFLVGLIPFYGGDFEKNLPIPFPFSLKNQSSFVYAMFWLLQLYILNLSALNNTALDILACSFMGIASAQLRILSEKLKRLVRKVEAEDQYFTLYGAHGINGKIKNCVKHHTTIEILVRLIDSTFTFMFLIQFLSSVTIICITEFTFILVPVASVQFGVSFLFTGCVMTQLAIYCAFGDDVVIQSSRIRDACYMSKWNSCDPAVRKSLFIIMERSKRPYVLTAGKFITLTLSSFITVVKSSFSYLTVLQKLYSKTQGTST